MYRFQLSACLVALIVCASSFAQVEKTTTSPPDYVTREEHEKVLKKLDTVMTELEAVKAKQNSAVNAKTTSSDVDNALAEVQQTVHDIQDQLKSTQPGRHQFLVTGYGFMMFEDHEGSPSTFSAGVNPIFLWRIGDKLIFESELEVEFNSAADGGGTNVNLEVANLSYAVTDWLIIGGGVFKTPLGIFNDRLESKWINKLPDRPLPYDDEKGIAQEGTMGAFAKGAFNTGVGQFNYALYIGNGPSLNSDGTLDFDNFVDANDNKAVGGRIGWLCLPGMEVGYSVQWAKVNQSGFDGTNALTQAVDLSYVKTYHEIKGQIDFRAEWVFSNVDPATYIIDGTPTRYNNNRNAGYIQLAYRPTLVANKFLKNTEFVFRYDRLNLSKSAPDGGAEQRYAFGIDYWINPSTVIKVAYECDDKEHGTGSNAFFIQGAMGF